MARTGLGLRGIHSIDLSVRDAAPWLAYWQAFGFGRVGVSTDVDVEATGTRRHVLAGTGPAIVLNERVHAGSAAERFLDRHPEGISAVRFQVGDLRTVEELLVERRAAVIDEPQAQGMPLFASGPADWRQLSIATPLGDVEFAFVECEQGRELIMPGVEASGDASVDKNPLGLIGVDHLTANVRTMMPVLAFYEHVMAFERHWDVQFHAESLSPGLGGGLKSVVMREEAGGIRLATNEPMRPRFGRSQVQASVDENGGAGIQHVSFSVKDIVAASRQLSMAGIDFLLPPAAYYAALPERIRARKMAPLDDDIDNLARTGILVDGDAEGCVLQVFCREPGERFARAAAGPLLIELIERRGGRGFGEGNFRALFEASRSR